MPLPANLPVRASLTGILSHVVQLQHAANRSDMSGQALPADLAIELEAVSRQLASLAERAEACAPAGKPKLRKED